LRINKFIAQNSGISRREADNLISSGKVIINEQLAINGQQVQPSDLVLVEGKRVNLIKKSAILLNKPVGYVCSRNPQGSRTIYELLPEEFYKLKPAGRLDKDSSGVLILTDDGELAQRLTHPKHQKEKAYRVRLNNNIQKTDLSILRRGVLLSDGMSKLNIRSFKGSELDLSMSEGRNRQIRRTFDKLGYQVTALHRYRIGSYSDKGLASGQYKKVPII
jgi:23S rRNA pseudouridine2605 synthase